MPLVLHRRRPAMGTCFEAWVVGDDAEHLAAVADAAFDEVEHVERLLSRFDPRSEVSRVNREAASRAVRVDYELLSVLRACRSGWERTDGAFDPTAGATGFSGVEIDEKRRTVRFATQGLALDFGGFGKGYALDRAADVLRSFGVHSALLHGGTSSVLALGPDAWSIVLREAATIDLSPRERSDAQRPGEGEPRVTVHSRSSAMSRVFRALPHPPAAPATSPGGRGLQTTRSGIRLHNRALSCSSVFAPDRDASDLVDPHTGRALDTPAACVVLDRSAAEAEILSTALLVMGRTRAALYAEREAREGLAIAWVEPNAAPEWLTGAP